jgi:hypothetical protein
MGEPEKGRAMSQALLDSNSLATVTPEIDIAEVRVTSACLERWQRESFGHVHQRDDGSIQSGSGRVHVHVFDDGRLGVSCTLSEAASVFLFAAPHEWWGV